MNIHSYIMAARGRRLRYGSHDCVTFAGRWAEAKSGLSLIPRYSSLSEGRDVLGHQSPVDVLAQHFEQVSVLMAQVGDVAVLPSRTDLPALGIICGHRIACFVGREIGYVALTDAQTVYRIARCHQ